MSEPNEMLGNLLDDLVDNPYSDVACQRIRDLFAELQQRPTWEDMAEALLRCAPSPKTKSLREDILREMKQNREPSK